MLSATSPVVHEGRPAPPTWISPQRYLEEALERWARIASQAGMKFEGLAVLGNLPGRVAMVERCARLVGYTLLMPAGEADLLNETYAFFDEEMRMRARFTGAIDETVRWLRIDYQRRVLEQATSEPAAAASALIKRL